VVGEVFISRIRGENMERDIHGFLTISFQAP
jgi:hypothetical protein